MRNVVLGEFVLGRDCNACHAPRHLTSPMKNFSHPHRLCKRNLIAVNMFENKCLLSLHVCGFATQHAQFIQHEPHMVTNLQQCGILSSVMIMWLKRAFMSPTLWFCILYKLSGPTNPDVLLQKIIFTLNSFA